MKTLRMLILGSALLVLGCEDENEQCIVTSIGYAGTADGPVYLVGEAADGSDRTAERSSSIAIAQASASETCSGGAASKVAWTFRAWIDVTGDAEERCAAFFGPRSPTASDAGEGPAADAGSASLDCAPLAGDPQVTVTQTVGKGRSNIRLEIVDR